MILQTKAAKVILSLLAVWLMGCAVYIGVTGWTGEETSVGTSAGESTTAPKESPHLPSAEVPLAVEVSSTPAATPTPSPAEPPPTPAQPPEEETTLPTNGVYIEPATLEASPGQDIRVTIMASVTDQGVSGCELVLSFSPSVFEITGLASGDLLGTGPIIGAEETDNDNGTVHYALARKGQTEIDDSRGAIAVVNLRVRGSAPSGVYELGIAQLELTNQEFRDIPTIDAKGAWIQVVK